MMRFLFKKSKEPQQDDAEQQKTSDRERRQLVWKLDRNIMPLVMVLQMLAVMDRSNIGSARIAGMDTDLGLVNGKDDEDDMKFEWLLLVFHIAYIIFEPLAIMWKIFPPHRWCAWCVMGWGLIGTLQATAASWEHLMILRFCLGAFEAAFGPGIPFLLSFFYPRNELGFRCGLYLASSPLAYSFTGILATLLTWKAPKTMAKWRLIFLVEGMPVLIAAIFAYFFIPDSIETSRFLSDDEKERAIGRMSTATEKGSEESHKLSWKALLPVLKDYKLWLCALMSFACNACHTSFPVFLPTILKDWGYTNLKAQAMTVPPYILALAVILISNYIADRTGKRAYTICVLSILGAVGYTITILLHYQDDGVTKNVLHSTRYAGILVAASGVFSSLTNLIPWILNNQKTSTEKGIGIAFVGLIGGCGPILGTFLFPKKHGEGDNGYYTGMLACAILMLLNGAFAIVLRFFLQRENKKKGEGEKKEDAFYYNL